MYRKNVAGQFIYFQLNKTADGTGLTGATVAVRRCIDGTFAAGGGTVTEDALGLYKYAMAQADTNGNDIGFQFTATGAIAVEKTVVTTAADPTDAAAFGLSRLDAAITTRMATFTPLTAAQIATGVWQDTTAGDFTVALSVGKSVMNGVTLGTGLTINQLTTNNDKTGYSLTAAYDPAKTAAQAGDAMALTSGERNSTADALLNRDMSVGTDSGSTTVRTVRQALRFLRNKWAIAAGSLTVFKEDDSTASWTAAVTTDGTAQPIVSNDPAGP